MATHNWPGLGLASVSYSLDRPATVNRSSYTGVRSVATNPWHGKWSFKVQLATMQGDGAFQAARAFFTSLKGQVDNFHLPAVEAPQNANTGVTVSSSAAAGAVTLALTGLTTALLVGNMATVHGQLLSITGITTLSGSAQTITFEPPLRAAAPSTTAVETAKPYALVALSTSDFAWDIGQWRRYGLSFDCDEAIGDTDGASPSGDIWNATFTSGGGVVSSNDNIIVKQNGTALGSLFNTLNFTGAVSVTSSGGGAEADIAISASGEAIYLKDHGVIADGVTVNSAAAVEALIAAVTGSQACVVYFPAGHSLFDRRIVVTGRPVVFRGYGRSIGTDATAGTLLEFPAGQTGFRIQPSAQNSRLEDMVIKQTSLLSTSQLGSYTSGATTITLNAAGDFANGQVVQLDGAGTDVVVYELLFNTTAGSAVVTWADTDGLFRGNSLGYNGIEIAIAGAAFPAGTTVLSWGINTATLSANAASTVTNATATVTAPIITEIVSGGGTTTLTIADLPRNTKTVASRKISHAAPGIYTTIQFHTKDVEVFETQMGMCVHGVTTGGTTADQGTFYNSRFGGGSTKFGVSLQGSDANVNAFFGCNFAGPEVGVLDQSFLGNEFVGCHWAFNCGLLVISTAAQTKLQGGYFETGTRWIVPDGGSCSFYGTTSVLPGYGMMGFTPYGGSLTGPDLVLLGPLNAKDNGRGAARGALIDGGFLASGSRPSYFTGNTNGVPGGSGTLSGVALGNSTGGAGGINLLVSHDNIGSGTTRELAIAASQFRIGNAPLGSQFGTWDATNGIRWRYPIGYDNGGNGVGAAVTQLTSKSTAPPAINKPTGQITTNNAALAAGAIVSFTVTDSQVAATDTVQVNLKSGNATAGTYRVWAEAIAAGTFIICVENRSAGSLSEALVLNFTVLKGANS